MADHNKKTLKIGSMQLRASINPDSFDADSNTIEVTFATETEVLRYNYNVGRFYETLSFKKGHVRFDRISSGNAPVLDNHRQWEGVTGQLGVVLEAKLESNQGRAKLKLSTAEKWKDTVQDIQDGIIRNVSVGYNVYAYEPIKTDEEETPKYRAVDWEPYEISFTPVPADYLSTVRNKDEATHEVEILSSNNRKSNMTPEEQEAKRKADEAAASSAEGAPTPSATTRTQEPNPPATPPIDEKLLKSEAAKSERNRISQINDLTRKMDFEGAEDLGRKAIEEGTSLDEFRKQAVDKWTEKDPTTVVQGASASITSDSLDQKRSFIETALELRTNPEAKDKDGKALTLPNEANEYRYMSLLDVAKEVLTDKGMSVRGLSPTELTERALSTSDYPLLLANVGNKTLMRAYNEASQTWRPLATRMDTSDFKSLSMVSVGGALSLDKVPESGEFKNAKLAENAETFKLETYGKMVTLTRQSIINDDMGAFGRILMMFGRSAARKESDLVWSLITDNPNMSDGKAVFHADHNNLLTASDLDEDGLTAARIAMMRQTGLDGEAINVTPKFLIVPPELLTKAEKLMTSIVATTSSDVNVFAQSLKIISDQRIKDPDDWYVASTPNEIDMLAYGYLNGNEGVYTETKYGFEVDGVQIKARLDFGASVIDYRGLQKTPGS